MDFLILIESISGSLLYFSSKQIGGLTDDCLVPFSR